MKNKGFTLAEVLITLGIIGVVAAITLPTLMQDGKKQQLGTKLAKFQSNLEKITRAAAIEGDFNTDIVTMTNILSDELLFSNDGFGSISGWGGGSGVGVTDSGTGQAILRDGTKMQIRYPGDSSTYSIYKSSAKYGTGLFQVVFDPDISGLSGGPKEFAFVITTKGFVLPSGNTTDQRATCLQKIYDAKYKATKVYGIVDECKDDSNSSGS